MKMLKDKYDVDIYPKEKFEYIYYQVFNSSNINPNVNINNLNKQVLKNINDDYISNSNIITNTNINTDSNIDIKLLIKDYISKRDNENNIQYKNTINPNPPINNNFNKYIKIDNNQSSNGRSFIINTFKNNININKQIINKIYPSYLCVPSIIKNTTPYIILAISEIVNNDNNITYTFVPNKICDIWDIWKPVNDKYINIELSSSNWTISLYDHTNNLIDLQIFYMHILDVIDINNFYELKINQYHNLIINEKIKIFSNNGLIYDSNIINFKCNDNSIIIIQKNNIKLENIINGKICSFKNQISMIFKTFPLSK